MLFPAAKFCDTIVGVDAHTTLVPAPPAPAPIPAPMVPHPYVGAVFLWNSPLFPAANVFINGMPAVTVGAKSISFHFPTPPGVWWLRPPTCFMKWFLTHVGTIALSTVFSTLTAAAGAMLGIGVPNTRQAASEIDPPLKNPDFWTAIQGALPQMNWMSIFRMVLPPVVLPVAEADISLGSPTVTVNGAPLAFIGPLTAGSCSDLPIIPNANTIGFSNVMVGLTLKELLMQIAWNAANAATSLLASKLAERAAGRIAGEPIDICTGAVIEDPVDMEIPGPIPFRWVRRYTSVLVHDGPLGWCWTHEYHRYLAIEKDHILYFDQEGRSTRFALLTEEQPVCELKQARMLLRRIDNDNFELTRGSDPVMTFTFDGLSNRVMLSKLWIVSGAHLRFMYDKKQRLVSIIDSGMRTYTLEYSRDDRIVSIMCVRDAYQNDVSMFMLGFDYDTPGNCVAVVDAAGNRECYAYDDAHRMVRRTNKLGYSFHYEYNNAGQCIKSYGDDDLYHVEFEHLPSVNMAKVTEPLGGIYLYRFDDHSRVIQIVDPFGQGRMYSYDKEGNQAVFVDRNADMTLYEYDKCHQKTGETDPLGRDSSWKYDEKGRLIENCEPDGNTSKRTYDDWDNLIEETAPDGAVTKYDYDKSGRIIATVFPDGSVIRFRYGPHSLPIAMLDAEGTTLETYEFDTLGNRTAIIAGSEKTRFHYDTLNRCCKVEYPDGTIEQRIFDAEGNVLSRKNRLGNMWHFQYGSWNKLTCVTDPEGHTTKYSYNKWDKIDGITDPNGNTFTFKHDLCNRRTGIFENGAVMETFELDPEGNIVGCFGPDGKPTLTFIRGKGGHVEKEILGDGKHIDYVYNDAGRCISADGDEFVQEREYDAVGRVTVEKCNTHEVRFGYEKSGVQVSTCFPGGREISRKFDLEQKILTICDPLGHEHILEYRSGRCIGRTTSWGLDEQIDFDSHGRVSAHTFQMPNNDKKEVCSRTYSYDAEGNLITSGNSQTGYRFYGYDRSMRLVSVSGEKGLETISYRYDAAGNIVSLPDGRSAAIDSGNRNIRAGEILYRYDMYGRLALKINGNETTRFEYDSAGLLLAVVHPDGKKTQYRYDAYRRRISKEHAGITTCFLWEGDRLIGEFVEDEWNRCYIYGTTDDLTPCAFTDHVKNGADWTGNSFAIHADHIGTPFAISNEQGTIVWSMEMLPYGSVSSWEKREIVFNLRLPGQYFDEETGLHYNRHRYYDPELGRYITTDPVGFSGGNNLYAYTRNPLKEIDFLGLHKGQDKKGKREEDSEETNSGKAKTNADLADGRKNGNPNDGSDSNQGNGKNKTGETSSTKMGKKVHKEKADNRRNSGDFNGPNDTVNKPFTDKDGNPIEVPKRVGKDGVPSKKTQKAIPDAVLGPPKGVIIDDKPEGRPISKDKQEMRRFCDAYEKQHGEPPKEIRIERYDPKTGEHVGTDIYDPSEFKNSPQEG